MLAASQACLTTALMATRLKTLNLQNLGQWLQLVGSGNILRIKARILVQVVGPACQAPADPQRPPDSQTTRCPQPLQRLLRRLLQSGQGPILLEKTRHRKSEAADAQSRRWGLDPESQGFTFLLHGVLNQQELHQFLDKLLCSGNTSTGHAAYKHQPPSVSPHAAARGFSGSESLE